MTARRQLAAPYRFQSWGPPLPSGSKPGYPTPESSRVRFRPGDRDRLHLVREIVVEHHGVFGTIWASLGMTAYYMAITWINILLGLVLTPLFMIPLTWVQDAFAKKYTVATRSAHSARH